MIDLGTTVTLLVAMFGLAGTIIASALARRHERQQQAREMLLAPAERFAQASLRALALLRYVTPPDGNDHRNAVLRRNPSDVSKRIDRCARAIDEVRAERAAIRLNFHPKSWAAERSRLVLAELRSCLQTAEAYYRGAARWSWTDIGIDSVSSIELDEAQGQLTQLRAQYMQHRRRIYSALDLFYEDVSHRIVSPTFDPRHIRAATPGPPS